MRSLISSIVLLLIIISSAQGRSLPDTESDIKSMRNYFIESPSYSDLLTLLTYPKTKIYTKKDDSDMIHQNIDETLSRKPEPLTLSNRRYFPTATRPTNHRNRLSNPYGRKSHWDTFFG